MLLGIDHLVIAVRDPDAAAAELERDAGLAFTGGGRHEAMGTFNRLAFLGDTYLELIGVFDRGLVESSVTFAVGRASMAVLDEGREGLATYALATDDVAGMWRGCGPVARPSRNRWRALGPGPTAAWCAGSRPSRRWGPTSRRS